MALVAIIGAFLSTTIYYLGQADFIAFTQNETIENSREAMEIITRSIHKADSVITPAAAGETSNTLVLSIGGNNVTYAVSPQGRLQIQEWAGSPVNITDNEVKITSLTFKRVQNSATKPTIQITMQTDYIGTVLRGPRPLYKLTTTVGLR